MEKAPPTKSSLSVDDRPTETDGLEFAPYARALVNLVAAEGTGTPLTVGVFGPWGSGKTSLMKLMQKALRDAGMPDVVWFDAWKYEREDALWRALIVQVLAYLRQGDPEEADPALDDLEASLYRVVEREEAGELRIDWGSVARGTGKAALHLAFSTIPVVGAFLGDKAREKSQQELASGDLGTLFDMVKRERHRIYREHIRSIEQFQDKFKQLVDARIVEQKKRLVVFIDDLDRCLPEKAVEVLEAIKLFLDVQGCVFVLGLDRTVIARGIEIRYREMKLVSDDPDARQRFAIEGRRYLEKIIQIPFKLPPVDPKVLNTYVHGLIDPWPDDRCSDVFATGTGESPRSIKRMVNTFLLLWEIQKARQLTGITAVRLAKVVALQQLAPPGFYEELEKVPRLLHDLEAYYRQERAPDRDARTPDEALAATPTPDVPFPAALERFGNRPVLKRLLTLHALDEPDANFVVMDGDTVVGLKPDELQPYFTLAQQVTTAPLEEPPARTPVVREPQVVAVPAGPFTMGTSSKEAQVAKGLGAEDNWLAPEQPQHEVLLSAYQIGKYPVTNAEYQAFVEAMGHQSPSHWAGTDYPDGLGGHPVVNVSWGDAMAYCAWLRERTQKPYTLPTEAEWEKAARGKDVRIFPWGNAWDPKRANGGEESANTTTPVGTYSPAGDSPYGAADMAGNVWEWCADWFSATTYKDRKGEQVEDPTGPASGDYRVLRGGAFDGSSLSLRGAARAWSFPNLRSLNLGFRVVVRPSLVSEPSDL